MKENAQDPLSQRRANKSKRALIVIACSLLLVTIGIVAFWGQSALGDSAGGVDVDQNAYINGSTTPQNGTSDDPQVVATGDTLQYAFNVTNSNPGAGTPPLVPNPAFQKQNSLARPVPINFKNGSFETPVVSSGANDSNIYVSQGNSVGWYTTASDGMIEIQKIIPRGLGGSTWAGRFADHTMDGGTQYAELNANMVGTLYQDAPTVPGTKVYYEFYHGARGYATGGVLNTDVMNFYLCAPNKSLDTGFVLQSTATTYTDPTSQYGPYVWTYQKGDYTVPTGQNTTRFAFESAGATGGDTYGNYLDGVRFYTSAYVELAKTNNATNKIAKIGDTVTYSIVAKNTGESDSRNTQVVDALPAGLELVPGSVRIDGTLTSNYIYDEASRQITVNVGFGATPTKGGVLKGINSFSLDCNNSYTVTFQVKVNDSAIAENLKYENQASVVFQDRNDRGATDFTNYSNVDAFNLDFVKTPASFTYVLPDGLMLVDYSTPHGATVTVDGNTITYTWDNLPTGDNPITITTKVEPDAETEFTSHGTITVGDQTADSNYTYHQLFTGFTAQKDAFINGSDVPQDGTAKAYQVVDPGDTIRYEISFDANIGGPDLPSDRSDNPAFETPAANPDANPVPGTGSFLELALASDAPDGKAAVGDTVDYTLQVTNSGADDASGAQISQTLPDGTDLVPGTVCINGLPVVNYNYNSATRLLSVGVGAGASGSSGGRVKGQGSDSTDSDDTYTVTFQVAVNNDSIAENLLYQSQAKVEYFDLVDPAPTSSVNYSNVDSFNRNAGSLTATVTDTIPDGLAIVDYEAPADSSFTEDGQTVTWTWDSLSPGLHTVAVTVSVGAGPQNEFVNQANVTIGGISTETDTTYHTTKVTVTERFVDHNNPSSLLQPDKVISMPVEQDYSLSPGIPPDTITKDGKTYKYWGYQVDGGQVFTGAPDPDNLPHEVVGPHTVSFLYIDGTESGAQKNAFINGGAATNGTAAYPAQVKVGDDLTYQINVDNPGAPDATSDVSYDVLFVVDWSGSMQDGNMYQNGMASANALTYARNMSRDMSQYVLANYPGSRVALLGMNSFVYKSNLNDPSSAYITSNISSGGNIFTDTPFVGNMDDFNTQVAPLFSVAAQPSCDDVGVFLQAGIDKMQGIDTLYGTNPAYYPRRVIPRDDQTRIPVIVLISDFQISQNLSPNYWTTCLKPQADRFAAAYPNSILMTVRMDTNLNSSSSNTSERYSYPAYDNLMIANVITTEYQKKLGWAFSKVPYNTTYDTALTNFRNTFTNSVLPPAPVIEPSTVTDVVPDGLTIVSTDPEANIDGQTVTWDMNQLPAGDTVLTVQTKVAEDGSFNNTAHINTWNEDPYDTNTTYHKTEKGLFEFYKVDEDDNPMPGVQFNLYSCSSAVKAGDETSGWLAGGDNPYCTWVHPISVTSASDGFVSFTNLMPGDYMLAEMHTLPGYELPNGQWKIVVDEDYSVTIIAHGSSDQTLPPAFKAAPDGSAQAGSLLLPNYRQMEMPYAGGAGVLFFTILGVTAIGLAVIFAFISRRRRRPE